MTTVQPLSWSTSEVKTDSALNQWKTYLESSLVELDVYSDSETFYAEMQQELLGPSLFSEMKTGAFTSKRTRSAISRSQWAPAYGLIQTRTGSIHYQHGKFEGVLNPGDCVLLDRTAPYTISTKGTSCITLGMPAGWLGGWVADPERLVGKKIDCKQGWGHVLSAMLWQLKKNELSDLALPLGTVADQIAGSLALTAGPNKQTVSRHIHKMYELARGRLQEMAFETDVNPTSLANDLNISKRHLHHLFAQEGTTFGHELSEFRLHRAKQLLEDPRFAKIPIGELAFRCGFADQSHFSKRFRKRFGVSPLAYKKLLIK